jgi:hypothetical protein
MSRYQPLADFLDGKKELEWNATFAEVEAQLGFPLPDSAYKYPAWWANQTGAGHSQTKGWRSVGWKTRDLDLERKRIRFEREARATNVERPAEEDERRSLMRKAAELTGIEDPEMLVREALRSLIAREAGRRLIRLGGTMPDIKIPPRERPTF